MELINEIKKQAKKSFCKLIISHHNYEVTQTYNELLEIVKESFLKGADIVKIACKSNS